MKMDFLFAPLPETNFQMTNEQLLLWQRNAIFECECDNFINRRIEAGRRTPRPNLRRPFEQTAINAAIEQHGLRTREHSFEADGAPPPLRQRILERGHELRHIYRDAIDMVIWDRGLLARRNP